MRLGAILKEGFRMVLPKWLRPKLLAGPTMKDLRQQVQDTKVEIQQHSSEIVEKCQIRRSGKTLEINPPVANGSH